VLPEEAGEPEGVTAPSRPADEQPRADEQSWAEEQPPAVEPLRVATALRAVPPDLLPAAEQEPLASAALPVPAELDAPAEQDSWLSSIKRDYAQEAPPPQAESDAPAEPDSWPFGIGRQYAQEAAFTAPSAPEPTPGSIGWLWPDETARPGGRGGRWMPPGGWRYRTAALVAAGVVVLGGAGVIIGLSLRSGSAAAPAASHSNSTPKSSVPPTTAPDPDRGLAQNIGAAATWINQQVAADTVIACDAPTCHALTADGWLASQVVQLGLSSQSLQNAGIVIVTPQLNSLFTSVNPSLRRYLTPVVLASFGEVKIQVVDSHGAAAYQAALKQDVGGWIALGKQLLAGGRVNASASAAEELTAGQVDPRVLQALRALAQQLPIHVLGFADSGPGARPGAPFREVVLAVTDPASGMTQSQYTHSLAGLLNAHVGLAAHGKASPTTLPGGLRAVEIWWQAPTPLGMLSP
jgi:hypothetical protein